MAKFTMECVSDRLLRPGCSASSEVGAKPIRAEIAPLNDILDLLHRWIATAGMLAGVELPAQYTRTGVAPAAECSAAPGHAFMIPKIRPCNFFWTLRDNPILV